MFCDFLPENEVRQIDPAQLSHVCNYLMCGRLPWRRCRVFGGVSC